MSKKGDFNVLGSVGGTGVPPHPTRVPFAIWFGILMVVAAALRIFALDVKSFWLDEAASSMLARIDWHTFVRAIIHRQSNMTFYYLLLRGWSRFGDSEAYLRSLSVIFGVAAIPLLHLFGRIIFDHRTARIAALLFTVHAFQIQYSQEARGYSLVIFLALLSCYFFIQLLSSSRRWILAAYIVSTALAIYTQVFASWILLVQSLWVFLVPSLREVRHRFIVAAGAVVALTIPLAVCLLALSSRSQLSWMNQSSVSSFHQLLLDVSGGGGNALLILELALLAASIAFSIVGDASRRNTYLFLWSWLLLPVVIMAISSLRWPILQSRYLIVCLPAFLLLVADGLSRIPSRVVFVAAVMGVIGLSLVGVSSYFQRRRDLRHSDNWRDATHYVLSEAQPGDTILFPYSAEEIPFREYQYRDGRARGELTVLPDRTDLELLSTAGTWATTDLALRAGESQRVWIITALQANDRIRAAEVALNTRAGIAEQRNFGFVRTQLFVSKKKHTQ
jgi:uncharacterized membrane protein